jgi:hypothetical protein
MRHLRPSLLLAAAALAGVGGTVAAQSSSDEPVLHEYVAPPKAGGSEDASKNGPKTLGGQPQPGKNPAAVRNGTRLVPEPPKSQPRQSGEPVHGTTDFGADRETQTRPDYATGSDSTLHYTEVFNPAVLPFKRMSALDGVAEGYMLHVHDDRLTALAVGGKTQADRDLFWGSLLVELEPGKDVPIPSTAPDMRILSYELDPPLQVSFSKDGADNYFVRTEARGAKGTYRLVFLSDAPASYFAPAVPKGYTIADARASGLVRPLPAQARAASTRVLAQLGLTAQVPLDAAVDKLVEYYRGFEAGDPPPPTDDIYLDLALSKRGVCRHRAFAFVITAEALGIPARYVTNEAHAFAEVWVPERHWIRVDLGGAALDMDVNNASDKQMYKPRTADAFPKPPEYANNYTQLKGDIRGLTKDQLADGQEGANGTGPNGNGSGANGAGANGADPGGTSRSTDPLAPSPGVGLPQIPASQYQGKQASRISVERADGAGFRGESVHVSGRLTDDKGKPVGGAAVNIYLAPLGAGGDGARLLGETYCDAEGRWEAVIDLPRDLPLGKHEVYASTPGDPKHQPALSH